VTVAVLGLWHLGSVITACVAAAGHDVMGWDPDADTVSGLAEARPPVSEPGLAALLAEGIAAWRLRVTTSLAEAVSGADIVWVAFDTPVDDEDRADVDFVLNHVMAAFPFLKDGVLVLSSSQLPVGSLARLEQAWGAAAGGRRVSFACSPENLRLGRAIEGFSTPDRVVIGVRTEPDRARLTTLFAPFTDRIEWMSVESAEMTKHAINAFLATSVTFINEIATLCEVAGADAKEVERGLKTEKRIGPHAYLSPGAAFAGGTLARDVMFLKALGHARDRDTPLMDGVESSNREHRTWARRRLATMLGDLRGRTIAVWGLTYKPGTDTLRRSTAVELCRWLLEQGAQVRVHDPAAEGLPPDLSAVMRAYSPVQAAEGAEALVVATEWPEYRQVNLDALASAMSGRLVVDANRFLGTTAGADERFTMASVGVASRPPTPGSRIPDPGSRQ
jgi:UDPglucose 6-dehydrogenase